MKASVFSDAQKAFILKQGVDGVVPLVVGTVGEGPAGCRVNHLGRTNLINAADIADGHQPKVKA